MLKIITTRITPRLLLNVAYNASKMQASSTQNGRDSQSKRLGLKAFGGQQVMPNDIIARQRGFKWKPGKNVIVGKDHTIHSACQGVVKFRQSEFRKRSYKIIDVQPAQLPNRQRKHPAPYTYHPQLFPQRAALNHKPIKLGEKNNRVLIQS